jgi:hypothetical protein
VRVKVDDPSQLPDLMEALRAQVDTVVARAGDSEVEVSILGSRSTDANVAELEDRLRRWPGVAYVVRDDR